MKMGIAFDKESVEDCQKVLSDNANWFFCHYHRKKFLQLIEEFPNRARIHTLYSANPRNQQNNTISQILDYLEIIAPHANDCEIFNECIGRYSNFKFKELVQEVRKLHPHLRLLYSDYNCFDLKKQHHIKTFIQELRLDGLAVQLHLALISKQWLKLQRLPELIKQFGRVDISEANIRISQPSILNLMENRPEQSINQIIPSGNHIQKIQWRYLINHCRRSGIENFYIWGTDRSFSNDKPSVINEKLNLKGILR